MSKKSARRTCEICGTKEARLESHLFFAKFPLDENRCREWVRVTGNQDLVHLPIEKLNSIRNICGIHFKKQDMNKKGNRLKKRAVPCLYLKSNPLSDEQMSEFPVHIWTSQVNQSKNAPSTSKEGQGPSIARSGVERGNNASLSKSTPSITKERQQHETVAVASSSHVEQMIPEFPDASSEPSQKQSTVPCDSEVSEAPSEPTFSWQKQSTAVPCDSGLNEESQQLQCEEAHDEIYMYDDDEGPSSGKAEAGKDSLPGDGEEPIRQEYQCDLCSGDISGLRYTCVQCPDYDLCAPCEARGAHALHYVLRVPGARPYSEIQAVLATIRRVLLTDSVIHLEGLAEDELKLEVKDEPDPIYVEQVATPGQPVAGVQSAAGLLQQESYTSDQGLLQDVETLEETAETLEENVETLEEIAQILEESVVTEENVETDEAIETDEDIEMLEEYIDSESSESPHSHRNDPSVVIASNISSSGQRVYITSKVTSRDQVKPQYRSVISCRSGGVIYKCLRKVDQRLLPAHTVGMQTRKRTLDACEKSNSDRKTYRIALSSTDVVKPQSARLVAVNTNTLTPEITKRSYSRAKR